MTITMEDLVNFRDLETKQRARVPKLMEAYEALLSERDAAIDSYLAIVERAYNAEMRVHELEKELEIWKSNSR